MPVRRRIKGPRINRNVLVQLSSRTNEGLANIDFSGQGMEMANRLHPRPGAKAC
jgi:hypothetical protein